MNPGLESCLESGDYCNCNDNIYGIRNIFGRVEREKFELSFVNCRRELRGEKKNVYNLQM